MCHFQNRGLIILIESILMFSFSKIKIQKNKKLIILRQRDHNEKEENKGPK